MPGCRGAVLPSFLSYARTGARREASPRRQDCQVEAAHQAGPQCLVGGEPLRHGAGGLGDRRGRVEDQGEGAVGLSRPQMGADHGRLGGDGGAHGLDDGGVLQRVGAGAALGEGEQRGPGQFERHRARQVEDDRVRLLVRGGLERLVQRYGDGAGRRVPAGEGVGGGEGGQRGAPPALSVGTAMSLVFSRRSPFSSSSTSPSTATTGTSSRASLSASRTGPTALPSSAQAASAALSRGRPSRRRRGRGVGNVLVRHGHRP